MRARELRSWAGERGYRIAWGPWSVYQEAIDELSLRRGAGEVDVAFDREYLTRSAPPLSSSEALDRWVILVLVPKPAHSVSFTSCGRTYKLLLPPTYIRYNLTRDDVLADLAASVFGGRTCLEPLPSLLKSVAVRLGLTAYGRNNVTYAEGFGSYFQIVGCSTAEDLTEGTVEPRAPKYMAACDSCHACAAACPTGAIPDDRFLLRAERCIVYFNERAEPLPRWIPPCAHRSLMGCLLCQTACPENARLLRIKPSGIAFSEEETRSILDPESAEQDPFRLSAERKLATLGLTEAPFPFWRNARAAFSARGWPGPGPAEHYPHAQQPG